MNETYFSRNNKPKLAYVYSEAGPAGRDHPLVMFCGGYRSDMNGTKATYLQEVCTGRGQAYLRFDYSGHGLSEGQFEEGTIGSWAEDALDMLNHVNPQEVVLVGSSMGGWIALLLALEKPDIVKGLAGIAPAPDFTQEKYEMLTDAQHAQLEEKGFLEEPNDYSDEPYIYTRALFEDGRQHLLLDRQHEISFPMRILQGKLDEPVPWQTAEKIKSVFKGPDTRIIYVEDGDHSLSRPEDLALLNEQIKELSGY